jgi:hypothetical protein
MKNIHVLPTEKPSRLMIDTIENKLYLQPILHKKTINVLPQHIYITSDEEIKEGDWLLIIDDFETYVYKHKGDNLPTTYHKKIILTTDQDLIADGVQAIDDEFLEWFVNNPSCESVEVKPLLSNNGRAFYGYRIVIPQEDPNQELLPDFKITKNIFDFVTDLSDTNKKEPKQETIEEILPKNSNGKYSRNEIEKAFELGIEWQAERMYSEEEVNNMFDTLKRNSIDNPVTISNVDLFIDSWKREFKNK